MVLQTLLSAQLEDVREFQEACMQLTVWDRGQDSADTSVTGCFVGVAKIASASSCIWKKKKSGEVLMSLQILQELQKTLQNCF